MTSNSIYNSKSAIYRTFSSLQCYSQFLCLWCCSIGLLKPRELFSGWFRYKYNVTTCGLYINSLTTELQIEHAWSAANLRSPYLTPWLNSMYIVYQYTIYITHDYCFVIALPFLKHCLSWNIKLNSSSEIKIFLLSAVIGYRRSWKPNKLFVNVTLN